MLLLRSWRSTEGARIWRGSLTRCPRSCRCTARLSPSQPWTLRNSSPISTTRYSCPSPASKLLVTASVCQCVSFSVSVGVSVCLLVTMPFSMLVSVSASRSACQSACQSECQSMRSSVCPSAVMKIHESVHQVTILCVFHLLFCTTLNVWCYFYLVYLNTPFCHHFECIRLGV